MLVSIRSVYFKLNIHNHNLKKRKIYNIYTTTTVVGEIYIKQIDII